MSKTGRDEYTKFSCSEKLSCLRDLKQIDYELAYLALLTAEGLKPLSRWEKPLSNEAVELLERLGLLIKQIQRPIKARSVVIETIFSRSPNCIDLYEQSFADTLIDKSPDTQRLEGFLFGYPPCCVEQYIRRPYTPNNLEPANQKLLFHWTCKNCAITPNLLTEYEKISTMLNNS
ncbi:hypothetical protein ACFLZ8_04250 [Planctomycetota bacterium]